jgi:hypothetical protein
MPRAVAVIGAAVLAVLFATTGFPQTPASSPTAPPSLSIASLVDQVVALFPQLDGEVIESQGQTLTISLGRKTGAQPGLVLEAVREGREIRHPKTGAVLGRAEESLGRAVVTQVFDGYSLATADRGDSIKPGDRVRTGTSRVKLALLPLKGAGMREPMVEAATNEIYETLNRSGRFQLSSGDQIAAWLAQEKVGPEDVVGGRGMRDALQRFKLENVLVLHYTMVERKPFVDARLFTSARAEAALATAFFVPPSVKPVPREQFSTGAKAPVPEKKQSLLARLLGIESDRTVYSAGEGALALKEIARLNFVITGMDVSSGAADQIPRMVLSDGERIYVYKIVNRVLEPDWTYYARTLGRVIGVQLADLTGDGTLSVVANRYDTRVGMTSFIVAMRAGKPTVVADQVDSILWAVDERGAGVKQTLWSQRFREDGFFFRGHADKMTLRNGALVKEHAAIVPENFRATGATFSNIAGKASRALVYIDPQNRLRVTNGTEEVWRSSTQVGGGGVKVEVIRPHLEARAGGKSVFHQMEPTPLAVDLDGDGIQEIIVPQNKDEDGVIAVVYRTAAGIRFQQVKSGFEGIIGGFGAIPGDDAAAAPSLITAVVRYRSFLKAGGETQIIMTVAE